MEDDDLARLVARDLTADLISRASDPDVIIFAFALWIGDDYGNFGLSVGTEQWFATLQPARALQALSEEDAYGPRYRWCSGNWDTIAEDFLSPETEHALAPLAEVLRRDDSSLDLFHETSQRWQEIGFAAVRLACLPSEASPRILLYGECPDSSYIDVAEGMLRSVTPRTFHDAIPAWRDLADSVRAAQGDEAIMRQIQELSRPARAGGGIVPEAQPHPVPGELGSRLQACGLSWRDLATGSDQLQRALAIADQT